MDRRFIALHGGVDAMDKNHEMRAILKNVMGEYYARNISKKHRIVDKMKGNSGVLLSPPPCNGRCMVLAEHGVKLLCIWDQLQFSDKGEVPN